MTPVVALAALALMLGLGLLLLRRPVRQAVRRISCRRLAPPRPPATPHPLAMPGGWREVSGLSKAQAEVLLDWLEANGYRERELTCTPDRLFTVRYR
jgi:hypothetical protein